MKRVIKSANGGNQTINDSVDSIKQVNIAGNDNEAVSEAKVVGADICGDTIQNKNQSESAGMVATPEAEIITGPVSLPDPVNDNGNDNPDSSDDVLETEPKEEVVDATSPFPDPMNALGGDVLIERFDQASSFTNIEELDVDQKNVERELALAKNSLPKDLYELKFKKAFVEALSLLNYELSLVPKINAIDTTHSGCRTDLKSSAERPRTKKEILREDYGLKPKTAWEIQRLTPELIKRIIVKAREEQRLPTRSLGMQILDQDKAIEEAESQVQKQDPQSEKAFEEKMARTHKKYEAIISQKPCVLDGELFNIIYADPSQTNMSLNDIAELKIPSADDAILFWWVQPGKLFESVEVIKRWGFYSADEAVWNMEDQVAFSGSCFNQCHHSLLVAKKGENSPKADKDARKKSVLTLRPEFDVVEKPAYYKESIQRMFPSGAYLDVFSKDGSNPNWTLFFSNETEVQNGTNHD